MFVQLSTRVKKIEKDFLILLTEDNQELKVSKASAEAISIGDAYIITIQPEIQAKMKQEELSRALLNTLLHDQSGS